MYCMFCVSARMFYNFLTCDLLPSFSPFSVHSSSPLPASMFALSPLSSRPRLTFSPRRPSFSGLSSNTFHLPSSIFIRLHCRYFYFFSSSSSRSARTFLNTREKIEKCPKERLNLSAHIYSQSQLSGGISPPEILIKH